MNENINMSNEEYKSYVESKAKKSPIGKNLIWAFLVGGLICVIGQLITNLFMYLGLSKDDALMVCTISLIFIGAFLTSINVYSKIGQHAGAGSIVPITGFSNSVVAPAIEFKTEGYVLGLGANMFKIAGPVIVYGIVTSTLYAVLRWLTIML